MNVHAKSRLILEPLRTLRPEDKGQAGACPDRTRAIPCTVQAVTGQSPGEEIAVRVKPHTTGTSRRMRPHLTATAAGNGTRQQPRGTGAPTGDMSGLKNGRSVSPYRAPRRVEQRDGREADTAAKYSNAP